jgi:hypothetical protein
VAHDRVAQVQRLGVDRFDPRDAGEDRPALRRTAQVAGQHRIAVAQFADGGNAFDQAGICCGASTSPAHWPYWVWLENCTVLSGQTFTPTRCMGNTAALLPAWPKTTWDWMASR